MEVKTTIASAFIDIVSQESSLNHEDTKFLHKTILSFIKLGKLMSNHQQKVSDLFMNNVDHGSLMLRNF